MSMRIIHLTLGLLICLFLASPVPGTDTPVKGAYFYLFDDAYDQAMATNETIPWDQINRLYLAFATIKDGKITNLESNSQVSADEKIRTVVSRCREKNPDAEIFISTNYGDDETGEYIRAAQNPPRFAESVLSYMQEYDLDGYDMDWEDRAINDYVDDQVSLLRACDEVFGKEGLLTPRNQQYGLTCTIWPGVHDPGTVAAYADFVDQFNLMTYGPGDLYDLTTFATQYAQAGVPYGKMIGGVESEFGYSENGGHDTQDSVNAKAQVVQSLGLAGLMNWRMDNDMATPDGVNEGGPATYQVTGWISRSLT